MKAICATFLCGFLLCGVAQAQERSAVPQEPWEIRRDTFSSFGDIDIRYRNGNRETRGGYINALRGTGDWVRRSQAGEIQAGARLQIVLEPDNPANTSPDRLRLSEAYGYYRFLFPGDVSAQFRAGQFALPFGLTQEYDPLLPVQPLYDKSLGLRVDLGVMVEGEYGEYRYAGSLTTGDGPNRRNFDDSYMLSFRLARTVETPLGSVDVGGSLLSGRGPVTQFGTELPVSGTIGAREYVRKSRFGADGILQRGPLLLRGEAVFGGDEEDAVFGYFAEGQYQVRPRVTAVAYRKFWRFGEDPQRTTTTGIGANYRLFDNVYLRLLYEYQRDVPLPSGTEPIVTRRFTLQTRFRF